MRLAISFDYDSPEGYRNSFGMQGWRADADQVGTDLLLRVLEAHDARATFAVVGRVALDGPAPEHCPEQLREIHAAGHEVASHSMFHRFLPPMRRKAGAPWKPASALRSAGLFHRSTAQCISRSAAPSA
jgi:peptidoglycan/xylan/chitin deacetylase (PgdA/CDA1 family)